jgi:hypothetical protein
MSLSSKVVKVKDINFKNNTKIKQIDMCQDREAKTKSFQTHKEQKKKKPRMGKEMEGEVVFPPCIYEL